MIVFSAELMDHIPLLTLIAVYTKDGFPDAAKKKKKTIKNTTKKLGIRKSSPGNTIIIAIMGNQG